MGDDEGQSGESKGAGEVMLWRVPMLLMLASLRRDERAARELLRELDMLDKLRLRIALARLSRWLERGGL